MKEVLNNAVKEYKQNRMELQSENTTSIGVVSDPKKQGL